MNNDEYVTKVSGDAKELIEAGHAIANAGYYMKKILREQALAEKAIKSYNNRLFREAKKEKTINDIEEELERLQKILKEKREEQSKN